MAKEKYPAAEIIEDYQGGVGLSEIRAKYNIKFDSVVYDILERHGIEASRRGINRQKRIKYDYQAIVNDYLGGMPMDDIAKKHGMPFRQSLVPILKKYGIEQDRVGGPKPFSMKPWNSEYFTGNTPTVAYWAGFLMADGSLQNETGNTWNLSLSIHERDLEHLWSFCDTISLGRDYAKPQLTKYRDKEYYMYRVTVYHRELPEQMKRWGIVQNKTSDFIEPVVPDDVLPDYLRGWLDGDGHITVTKRGSHLLGVTGNLQGLHWYAEALRKVGFSGKVIVKPGKNAWGRLYIHGSSSSKRVAHLLRCDTEPRLHRKWDKV